jgi:hypothetical protein
MKVQSAISLGAEFATAGVIWPVLLVIQAAEEGYCHGDMQL